MNIIVITSDNHITVRPDTTWERDNEDLFLPEFITDLTYSPVLFARICKPGRSIAEKFATRYFDAVGYGLLLYPENLIDGSDYGIAAASCIDHTSFLSMPASSPEQATYGGAFSLSIGGTEVFTHKGFSGRMITGAIEQASSRIYFRTGDLIAIELDTRKPVPQYNEIEVSGLYRNERVLDFKIKR